jgi:hypothetical protein
MKNINKEFMMKKYEKSTEAMNSIQITLYGNYLRSNEKITVGRIPLSLPLK